jgi:hypothetical protein
MSEAFVRMSRARVPQAECSVGSIFDVDLPRAHAICAIGEVINYLADTNNSLDAIRAFFERAYTAPNLLRNYFDAEKAQSASWCHSGEGAFSTYAATCSKRMVVSNA